MRLSLSPHPLAARLPDRLAHALRPGWSRSILLRRAASVLLIVAALLVGLRAESGASDHSVLVAAHDVVPGHVVTADDLATRRVPGAVVPTGAVRLRADALGLTVSSRVRAGEILTDTRLIGSRLPQLLTDRSDARLVPVRPADSSVASLLREGDIVDVLAPDAALLARRAVVALTSTNAASGGSMLSGPSASSPILLAMDAGAAHRVATAGLDSALALVIH